MTLTIYLVIIVMIYILQKCISLVVTDDMVTSLNVTNAHVLLNYDLPDSKTKFGNRLACMHDYFEDRFQKRKACVFLFSFYC